MNTVKELSGSLVVPAGARFCIVVGRFNSFITERLIEGALDALTRHGADPANLVVVRVPGSWEIPAICKRLAAGGKFDAIVAVSAVIRGATSHFDFVANEVSKGIAQITLDTGVPIGFGVLTTDTIEQAVERAGSKAGNKGFDAAMAAIEMVSLRAVLSAEGY